MCGVVKSYMSWPESPSTCWFNKLLSSCTSAVDDVGISRGVSQYLGPGALLTCAWWHHSVVTLQQGCAHPAKIAERSMFYDKKCLEHPFSLVG